MSAAVAILAYSIYAGGLTDQSFHWIHISVDGSSGKMFAAKITASSVKILSI